MTVAPSEVFQARLSPELADQVRRDIEILELDGTSAAIREGLILLHRKAREIELERSYTEFYGDAMAPESPLAEWQAENPNA